VIERRGASGTSPSGTRRTISSGPEGAGCGRTAALSGGKAVPTVRPVRGGGSEASRIAKGSSLGPAASGGSRSSTRRASASESGSAAGRATSSFGPPVSVPSLKRNVRPAASPSPAGGPPVTARLTSASPTAVANTSTSPESIRRAHHIGGLPSLGEDTAGGGLPFPDFGI
jgi:hypothetical protein